MGCGGIARDFDSMVGQVTGARLTATGLDTLQVNVGLRCNQRCSHCHVSAEPGRKEMMSWPTMRMVLDAARSSKPSLVDITGGAPELNPRLGRFVSALREDGHTVQVRTNLTILLLRRMAPLLDLFKDAEVKLVASFPCYRRDEVDAVRGEGVFERSVEALKMLNAMGYGRKRNLQLDLVFNPESAFLPAGQADLEEEYRQELREEYRIMFNNLITIANMPIGRFAVMLRRKGLEESYDRLLRRSFNSKTIDQLMCRRQVTVGWDGSIYDCDFNLALGHTVDHGAPPHVRDFQRSAYIGRRIVTGPHCFGCTAGQGSSCGGALVK